VLKKEDGTLIWHPILKLNQNGQNMSLPYNPAIVSKKQNQAK
jgi:hypothetical protein